MQGSVAGQSDPKASDFHVSEIRVSNFHVFPLLGV